MNFKTTLILFILVIIAGAVIFFSRGKMTTQEVEEQIAESYDADGALVFEPGLIDTESVTTINITLDNELISYEKQGDKWFQQSPVQFPINQWDITTLITNVKDLRFTRKFTPGKNDQPTLKQIGLDKPRAVITLADADKQIVTLNLGRKSLGGKSYIAIQNHDQVYLATDDIYRHIIDKDINNWRSKSLACPQEPNASELSITIDGQPVTAVKAAGQWYFSPGSPLVGRVDPKTVNMLLSSVNSIYISDFAPDAPTTAALSMYGLDQPDTTLSVTEIKTLAPETQTEAPTDSGETSEAAEPETVTTTYTLRVGLPVDNKREKYFASWSRGQQPGRVVFEISANDLDKLKIDINEMRDPRITTIAGTDVSDIIIDKPNQQLVRLNRTSDGWSFAKPAPPYSADPGYIADLVNKISQTKAVGYLDNHTPIETLAQLEISGLGMIEPEVLTITPAETSDMLVVQLNDEPTGYVIPATAMQDILNAPLALRERTIIDFPADRINQITFTQSDSESFTFTRNITIQNDKPVVSPWALQNHESYESQSLSNLFAHLVPLRAEKWLTTDTQPTGLTLTIQTIDGQSATLTIDPHTRIATIGQDQFFTISQSLVDALNAEFRNRTALAIERDNIQSVTITQNENPLTITLDEQNNYVTPDNQPVNQESAAAIFDLLTNLRVLNFLPDPITAAPTATITIQTKDNQSHTIALYTDQQASITTADQTRWCTLDEQTVKTLTATPTQ